MILANVLLARGESGVLHLIVVGRYLLALIIICSYSRVPFVTPQRFGVSVVFVLGLFAWISIPTLMENPMIARMTQLDEDFYESMLYRGITRYNAYAAGAIFLPCFVGASYAIRRTAIKHFFVILCLGIALAVAFSGFMAAFVTLTASLILLFLTMLFRGGRRKSLGMRPFGILVTVSLILGGVWYFGTGSEGFDYASEKALRIFQGVKTSGIAMGDETGRFDLFLMSLNTFLSNPLFGIGPITDSIYVEQSTVIGCHSSIMDSLGEYGILGFSPFLLFLGLLARRVILGMRFGADPLLSRAVGVAYIAFLVTSIYNMTLWVPDIIVLLIGFVVINSFPHCLIRIPVSGIWCGASSWDSVPPNRHDHKPASNGELQVSRPRAFLKGYSNQ